MIRRGCSSLSGVCLTAGGALAAQLVQLQALLSNATLAANINTNAVIDQLNEQVITSAFLFFCPRGSPR